MASECLAGEHLLAPSKLQPRVGFVCSAALILAQTAQLAADNSRIAVSTGDLRPIPCLLPTFAPLPPAAPLLLTALKRFVIVRNIPDIADKTPQELGSISAASCSALGKAGHGRVQVGLGGGAGRSASLAAVTPAVLCPRIASQLAAQVGRAHSTCSHPPARPASPNFRPGAVAAQLCCGRQDLLHLPCHRQGGYQGPRQPRRVSRQQRGCLLSCAAMLRMLRPLDAGPPCKSAPSCMQRTPAHPYFPFSLLVQVPGDLHPRGHHHH